MVVGTVAALGITGLWSVVLQLQSKSCCTSVGVVIEANT